MNVGWDSMKRFYLTGQNNFGNRGCEAIVRGTVSLLSEQFGDIEVYVPSYDIERDSKQWPEAEKAGVRFVPYFSPWYTRYWIHLQRLPVSFIKRAGWPFPIPKHLTDMLASMDAVLSIGGDNYSLDYLLPSLLMGVDGAAMRTGTPVILWGASVGPFDKEPAFVPVVQKHLRGFRFIAVRELISKEYLQKLDIDSIHVCDPAFMMEAEPVNLNDFWPDSSPNGVLGFNVSPLLHRYRSNESKEVLLKEYASFIKEVIDRYHMSVLLVPHVIPLNGATDNNDALYMQQILDYLGDKTGKVTLMNPRLNAPQIKYVISKCRFFIGARTHSTIAALSSNIPTVSIAYSIKARGINQDIFGHTNYVLDLNNVNYHSLINHFDSLIKNEEIIIEQLKARQKNWIEKKDMLLAMLSREVEE